jgi:hypothetical protein
VIVHGPAATVVTTEPVTVHTDDVPELNDTGSPDDACADRVTGVPTVTSGGCANVIVGAAGVVASTSLGKGISRAFCTFADGLVSW